MYDPNLIFTEEEIKQIQRLGISIANNMTPLQYKDHYFMSNGRMWDIDTYSMGACRCLTMNENEFKEYHNSKKYDFNTMGNLDIITRICYEFKIPYFLKLKELCLFAEEIIICEAGRGVDIILASLIKPWKRIVAYDQDKATVYELKKYFKGELGLPFEGQQINTLNYDFAGINEKTIIVSTCHNIGIKKQEEILSNANLVGILDGNVLIHDKVI